MAKQALIIDFKCVFIVIFILSLINQQEFNKKDYALCLSETMNDVNNEQMFEFVVRNPQVVNKVNKFQWIIKDVLSFSNKS